MRITLSTMTSFSVFSLFFFNDTATTEIYTLSLHDALPILPACSGCEDALRRRITSRLISRCVPSMACLPASVAASLRSEEHTSELQSQSNLVCRLLLEKKKK